jgi:cobalt-zinc-cadmium resistance protein CzcA
MITRIVDTSLDNRALVIVLWLLVAAAGLEALRTLPIDAVPDVTNVQVQVLTNSPGLAPEEVERLVTVPVEHAMSGLPDLAEVRSVSKFGLSVVTVVFEDGTHPDWARQRVGERLSAARGEIPPGYGEPELGPVSSGLGEIYQFEVRGEPACAPGTNDTPTCYSPLELREILDWFVVPQLRAVRGVVEVNAFGGELKTWQVTVDPEKLAARGIAIGEVFAALQANNRNAGGGYIEHHGEQYLVRGEGLVERPEDIADVVLRVDADGAPVHVHDVARVTFAPMLRQGAVTRDGRGEAVVGIVMMLAGENARTVVDRVKERAAALRQGMPPGVTLDVFYDRTELVRSTIATVARNLAFGGLLVVLVLLLLLGNLRAGLIVAVSIPLSMLVAFIGMRAVGLSGNLMSLGAIDFGLIVDGSVVMIENIVRVLSHPAGAGETRTERVRAAARQVARPVVFAVGVIVIVYLPLLALRGVEGRMFVPMALTVVFALAGSLVCALTLMPVLASLFLYRLSERPSRLFALARRLYAPALNRAMSHPRRTAGLAAVAFVGSLGIAPFLGAEFIPRLDEGAIALQIWRLPSVSLSQSNALSTLAEQVLVEQFPNEVSTVVSRTGRAEIATDPMGVEISDVYVMLHLRERWRFASKEALITAMNDALVRAVPAAVFSYSQPIELRVAELISGVRSDVAVHVYGDDLEHLRETGEQIARVLADVPGAAEAKAEQTAGLPLLRVRVDRAALARYGLNAEAVLDVVEAIGGKRVGVVLDGQRRFDLTVRFADEARADPERVRDLRVVGPAPGGGTRLIPLSQLARVEIEDGPAQISRDHQSRRINIEVNVRGRDLASFVTDARARVDAVVTLPPGYTMDWGGQFENLEAATDRLAVLVPLALLLIFALLFTAFGSQALAALVFFNVPLAVSGGLAALALRGYPLSISAGVGFIALFGVAVLNGVVLVSAIVERRDAGLDPFDAAVEAARLRLRPVLMTALVASMGFVPMALAQSAGAEVQRPLATVVIGGLVTATLLTLFVLPALYAALARKRP